MRNNEATPTQTAGSHVNSNRRRWGTYRGNFRLSNHGGSGGALKGIALGAHVALDTLSLRDGHADTLGVKPIVTPVTPANIIMRMTAPNTSMHIRRSGV